MVVVLVCGGIAFLHWQRESAVCSYPNCAISTSDTVYASLHVYGGAVLLRKEKTRKKTTGQRGHLHDAHGAALVTLVLHNMVIEMHVFLLV